MTDPDERDDHAYHGGRSFKYKLFVRVGSDLPIKCCGEMTCSFRFVLTIETNRTDFKMAVGLVENGGELIRSLDAR